MKKTILAVAIPSILAGQRKHLKSIKMIQKKLSYMVVFQLLAVRPQL